MSELKPCPFCGGPATFVEREKRLHGDHYASDNVVRCTSCGFEKAVYNFGGDEAAKLWNRRAPDAGQNISCEYCGLVGGDHLWNCPMIELDELPADEDIAAQWCKELVAALKRLSFAAQTTGGTAGRDEELCAAINQAEEALSIRATNRALIMAEQAQAQAEPVADERTAFSKWRAGEKIYPPGEVDSAEWCWRAFQAGAEFVRTHPQQPAESQEPVAYIVESDAGESIIFASSLQYVDTKGCRITVLYTQTQRPAVPTITEKMIELAMNGFCHLMRGRDYREVSMDEFRAAIKQSLEFAAAPGMGGE